MSARRERKPRLASLVVLAFALLFVAGPTPGDVGGCGGDEAATPVPGGQAEAEYDYFDQGFCAHMCFRLRSCGVLCRALDRAPPDCERNIFAPEPYLQCLRGAIRRDIFGYDRCPHTCANYPPGRFTLGASYQDVEVCGHAIDELSCTAIADVIRRPPTECTAVCLQ